MSDKIVVTGIGLATPIGSSFEEVSKNLQLGKSGVSLSKNIEEKKFITHHAGYINYTSLDLEEEQNKDHKLLKLTHHCMKQVIRSASLDEDYLLKKRANIILGAEPPCIDLFTNITDMMKEEIDYKVRPMNFGLSPHEILSEIAQKYSFRGSAYFHLGTCSASSQAIGEAMLQLKHKRSDVVLCGGISSRVDPFSMARLSRVGALAPTDDSPESLSMPFDLNRKGFTMGEGAVFLILERESDALARGANPICYICGYGTALDGSSITDPHPESLGMILSMKRALLTAGLEYSDVDYINAHGTSTPKNDYHETKAIKRVFGPYAHKVNISSSKSLHGHLMSAAGAIEAAVSIASILFDFIPPTINYKLPDPQCDLNYTPLISINKKLRYAMSNSFGLGGQNSALIFGRYNL